MDRRAAFLLALLAASAFSCENTPDPRTFHPKEAPPIVPPAPPSEEAEDPTTLARYQVTIARAQHAKDARRSIEALQLYRQAWTNAPPTLPQEERERLKKEIERLAFLLGVPEGLPEPRRTRQSHSHEAESAALRRARRLYQDAQNASDKEHAMALLREVLATITPQDDTSLYWRAWQRLEDLSPEGEGPAAVQERLDRAEENERSKDEPASQELDGRFIPGAPSAAEKGRADDMNLSRARSAYVRGMDYVQVGEKILARQSFQEVLELIRESQDPELVHSARQNLKALEENRR